MEVRGYIELRTTFTDEAGSRTEKIKYLIVNTPSAYNILLGRPTLNRIGAIPSTRHMKVQLSSMEGVDGRGPSTSPHASPPKGRFGPTIELWPRGSKKTFFYMFKCHKL